MTKKLSVSLGAEHVRIIRAYGKKRGIKQFSTALQSLLHSYDRTFRVTKPQSEVGAEIEPVESVPLAA